MLDRGGAPASARLLAYRLILEDREISLRPGENLLGRVEEGVVWIEAPPPFRAVMRGSSSRGRAILEDLGSKNGTFVRGTRITVPTPLANGDVIRLGRVSMKLRIVRADASTASEAD